jgi:GNAT superfamily N-acetyltransferase
MEIREVKKEEIKDFWKQEWRKFDEELGFQWKDRAVMLAAYEGSEILGAALIKLLGGCAYLEQLIIAKSQRGKGMGSSLMKEFENLAKKEGCHKLTIKTTDKMPGTIPFYKKHGYKIEATLKKYYFKHDWVIMSKFI